MTARTSELVSLVAPVSVVVECTRPVQPRPDNAGRKGGRWRWWIAHSGYGSRAWKRRSGYVEIPGDPESRSGDLPFVAFRAELYPGGTYTVGIGDARYHVTVPLTFPTEPRVRIEPDTLCEAGVYWSSAAPMDSEIPF